MIISDKTKELITYGLKEEPHFTSFSRDDDTVVLLTHKEAIPAECIENIESCVYSKDFLVIAMLPFVLDSLPDTIWVIGTPEDAEERLVHKVLADGDTADEFEELVRDCTSAGKTYSYMAMRIKPMQLFIVDTTGDNYDFITKLLPQFYTGKDTDVEVGKAALSGNKELFWDFAPYGFINKTAIRSKLEHLKRIDSPNRELPYRVKMKYKPSERGASDIEFLVVEPVDDGSVSAHLHRTASHAVRRLIRLNCASVIQLAEKDTPRIVLEDGWCELEIDCTLTNAMTSLYIVDKEPLK